MYNIIMHSTDVYIVIVSISTGMNFIIGYLCCMEDYYPLAMYVVYTVVYV